MGNTWIDQCECERVINGCWFRERGTSGRAQGGVWMDKKGEKAAPKQRKGGKSERERKSEKRWRDDGEIEQEARKRQTRQDEMDSRTFIIIPNVPPLESHFR